METSTKVSGEWGNFELNTDKDDSPTQNDFHFGYLTLETSTEAEQSQNDDQSVVQINEFQNNVAPVFYETIPCLQEITSYVVAVALWRRLIHLKYPNHITNPGPNLDVIREEDRKEVDNLLQNLPVPRLIRETVAKYLERVQDEMNNWLRHCKQNIYQRNSITVTRKICDLLFCIWLPNGKIDDKRSALNMLSNPRLTQVDKFRIMCRYCLEDKLKEVAPGSLPSSFTKRINSGNNTLVYYWLCYVNGKLDKLPKTNDKSIESTLITAFNVDTWSAIEYFWDRLNVNEQISKAEELLTRRPQFQKQLFSKMNEFHKNHLLYKMPVEIATNFWKQEGQERFTFLTWIYVRNFVNYEQFENLIKTLLSFLSDSQPHHDDKILYLVDIWNYAPDHLKIQSLQRNMIHMIIKMHTCYYDEPFCNIEFLLAYLSYLSIKARRKIIYELANELVLRIKPSVIDPLIKLCLPKTEEVLGFKKYVLESNFIRERCCDQLHNNTLHELNSFLDYYCSDPNARVEFCIKILELFRVRGCPFYCLPKWIETIEFIDSNLLDSSPHQAMRFKNRLAKSFAGFCCELWSNDSEDEMNKMIDVVSQVLDTEEIREFKARALEKVQTRYRWSNFDEKVINGFILWCYDDDAERAREYKKSLSIDGIFENGFTTMRYNRVLRDEVDQETVFKIFHPVDKALFWYFEDLEDAKGYKLKVAFGLDDSEVSVFRRYSQMKDDVFKRNTLPWFFQGDREQIAKFKEQFKNEDICKFI